MATITKMSKKIKELKQTVDICKTSTSTKEMFNKVLVSNQMLKIRNFELEEKLSDYEVKTQTIQRLTTLIKEKESQIE